MSFIVGILEQHRERLIAEGDTHYCAILDGAIADQQDAMAKQAEFQARGDAAMAAPLAINPADDAGDIKAQNGRIADLAGVTLASRALAVSELRDAP